MASVGVESAGQAAALNLQALCEGSAFGPEPTPESEVVMPRPEFETRNDIQTVLR